MFDDPIEDAATLNLLQELGCDIGQGYHISRRWDRRDRCGQGSTLPRCLTTPLVDSNAVDFAFTTELREQIERNLAQFEPLSLDSDGHLPAAVGVVLLPDAEGDTRFVLTRRLMTLRRHRGQWALPGGRLEAGESAEQAALREIHEEVGVDLPQEAILGRLDDFLSRSGHLITPFVVWSHSAQQLRANPEEVDEAFQVPLRDLDRPGNLEFEPLLHFVDLVGSTVHAPTAAILYQFREVALHGREVRVSDVEQPNFAWR